jgi:hypothetical protein
MKWLLSIYTTSDGHNVLVPLANSTVDNSGGTARYASLDYSGVDATVAFHLYF